MLIAQDKKRNNIAEYVLYMWQIEDLIRAHSFDIDAIEVAHIYPMTDDAALRIEVRAWYEKIIREMRTSDMLATGHLTEVREVLMELNYLHASLLNVTNDQAYQKMYQAALPDLQTFRQKSEAGSVNDVELSFNGLYMKMMLGMQKKEVSPDTAAAMESFKQLVVYLATAWHRARKINPSLTAN